MRKSTAERRRPIDFSTARRGPVVAAEPGKTKISIRLDNAILAFFRAHVDKAGGGNYQTLINEALIEHVHKHTTLDAVRQVVREELAAYSAEGSATSRARPRRARQTKPTARRLAASARAPRP